MFFGNPAASPTSRAMFGNCTEGITVPKTIWSMLAGGISARCTSSATTCRDDSSAERSLKAVPDLTKGVRRPATIATRRPVLGAMATSEWGRVGNSGGAARQWQRQKRTAGDAEDAEKPLFGFWKGNLRVLRVSAVRLEPLPFVTQFQ